MSWTRVAMLIAFSVPTPALADLCQLNSKPVAERALLLLTGTNKLIIHCNNCRNTKAYTVAMNRAEVTATDDPSYFEVRIDGSAVDLAYLYYLPVPGAQQWVNLGFSAGCADAQTIGVVAMPREMSDAAGPPPPRSGR